MKKTAYLGMFLAISLILSYVESILPVTAPIPGIKLGLANCAILVLLYLYGPWEAILVNVARVTLSAFMFNGLFSLLYSLSGAILSFLVMFLLNRKKKTLSPVGIGMLGGVFHNIGQIIMAFVVTHVKGLIYYLPFLLVSGLITGFIIGFLTKLLLPYLKKTILVKNGNPKKEE